MLGRAGRPGRSPRCCAERFARSRSTAFAHPLGSSGLRKDVFCQLRREHDEAALPHPLGRQVGRGRPERGAEPCCERLAAPRRWHHPICGACPYTVIPRSDPCVGDPCLRSLRAQDELHRWSKAQQDALLLDVEKGTITLIGATTENPSFTINNAILSRCRLVVFEKVAASALQALLERALVTDAALAGAELCPEARRALLAAADGDARVALNILELAAAAAATGHGKAPDGTDPAADPAGGASSQRAGSARWVIAEAAVLSAVQRRPTYYDRDGEMHYDLISGLHKSLRGGDADGALYYCARMLAGGEEPRYVTRRLIRFASEDVGLADPLALQQAVAADAATHAIGMPECGVVIGQCAVYLALAPKSCAIYKAFSAAMQAATDEPRCPVPLHIRNAPTKMMAAIGYGKGYVYNPSNGYSRGCPQGYLPSELGIGRTFFDPTDVEPGHTLRFCGGEDATNGRGGQ